jgi:hypothetical protein
MIYITFDGTKKGLSFLGSTPQQQLEAADERIAKSGDIELHLGAQHEAFVLRLLRRVREGVLSPDKIQFYDQGSLNHVTPDGDFEKPIKGGFFVWRADELF